MNCNETNKNSTCVLTPDHPGRHFDPRNGHSWSSSLAPAPVVNTDNVHRSHCCTVHGCKYATSQNEENACPVSNGTLQQDAPCEHCDYNVEALRQVTDAQIQDELTRRGYHDAAACLS